MNTQINTTIPTEVYQHVIKNKWKHNEIYMLGFKAKMENPQLIKRINELEEGNEKLQYALTRMSGKIAVLEELQK